MAVGVSFVPVVSYLTYAREMMKGIVMPVVLYFGYARETTTTYVVVRLSYTMRVTSRIAVCLPHQRSSIHGAVHEMKKPVVRKYSVTHVMMQCVLEISIGMCSSR